jgi:protein-S-isoprenylcysteine O-methyltransferase Ste14
MPDEKDVSISRRPDGPHRRVPRRARGLPTAGAGAARVVLRGLVSAVATGATVVVAWSAAAGGRFADEPARVLATVLLVIGVSAVSAALRYRVTGAAEDRAQRIMPFVTFAGVVVVVGSATLADATLGTHASLRVGAPVRWLGVVLLVTGLGLQYWAINTLGRWFTVKVVVQVGQELVSTGPYRRLLHPSYTGLLLWMTALPLAFGTWLGLPMLLVAMPLVIFRMQAEERLLATCFGERFDVRLTSCKRLIPWVY